jgi:hypothetical protein
MEKLQSMCVNLVGEIIESVDDTSTQFSDKTVWGFMREYERLRKREKHLKKSGINDKLLNKSSRYRHIIKKFAKRMVDPDFKS